MATLVTRMDMIALQLGLGSRISRCSKEGNCEAPPKRPKSFLVWMATLVTRMNMIALQLGLGSRISRCSKEGSGETPSKRPKSCLRDFRGSSAVDKPPVMKKFSSTNVWSIMVLVVDKPPVRKKFSSTNVWSIMVLVVVAWTYCSPLVSAQSNFNIQSTGYSCSSNLVCFGDAHVYNGSFNNGIQAGRLSLIGEGNYNQSIHQAGVAYYNKPVQLLDASTGKSGSFSTNFAIDQVWGVYNGSNIRGDGMAFVISALGTNLSLGTADFGSFLGIFNINATTNFKSIVVELDTIQNDYTPMYDISDSHISFDFMNITYAAAANTSNDGMNLAWESTLYIWVDYSNETQQLEARISNVNFKPIYALLNYTLDLSTVVDEYMWVGFSSASGDSYSNFYVGDWTFESYGFASGSIILPPGSKSGGSNLGLIVGVVVGICAFLVACGILGALFTRRKSGRRGSPSEDPMMHILEGMPERFSYKQLSVATKSFSEDSKLGRGGFGTVYRGVLPSTGAEVAVKKISSDSSQGEKEFMAEISIISQLRHRNLIQLQGWCKDSSRRKYLLVYELMPNGSLDKVLFGSTESQSESQSESQPECLSWAQRFNIVTGTAAAVDYLHQGWKQQVIHRDIKSSNIMLDAEWNAKLGDFGLARLVDHKREAASTMMAGTYGYIAPEVAASGRFTDKTDVFAFGAVVLEVACGRRALSSDLPEDEMILVDWVWRRLSQGDLMSTVDKRLNDDYDPHWMEVVLSVGLLCSHPNPLDRPSMRHVVEVLAGDLPVPALPSTKPAPPISFRTPKFSISFTPKSRSRSGSGPLSLTSPDKADSSSSHSSTMKSFGTSSSSHTSAT